MYIVQRVLNCLKNINPLIKAYVISLMLSSSRKNCAAMARSVNVSEKKLYHFLNESAINSQEIAKQLLALAHETRQEGTLRALVVDPTAIIKNYAQKIEKLCYDRAGCTKKVEKVLVPVYASVTDKNVSIPLDLEFWLQEKITGKKKYKSKVKITQELIIALKKSGLDFDYTALDGAFSTPNMFAFFKAEKEKFTMRIAKNRVVKFNGVSAQLKNHPALKLWRNEREKTISAQLGEDTYFFTAHKRKARNGGWETVYIVSNMNLSAKEQVAAYNLRWPIEKMIRTTKQKFGATQCQTVSASKQRAHILAGFFAYAILNVAEKDKQNNSVDVIVNTLREFYYDDLIDIINERKKDDVVVNAVPITNKLQNSFQNLQYSCDQVSALGT